MRKENEKKESGIIDEMIAEINAEFESRDIVKKYTKNLSVKSLREIANRVIGKGKRALMIVNSVGDNINLIAASSSDKSAIEISRKLGEKLGIEVHGDKKISIGGGKSKDAEKILYEFKI